MFLRRANTQEIREFSDRSASALAKVIGVSSWKKKDLDLESVRPG